MDKTKYFSKDNAKESNPFIWFVMALMVVALFGSLANYVGTVAQSKDVRSESTSSLSSSFLNNGSNYTIPGSHVTSNNFNSSLQSSNYNMSWLSFDGVNDYINASDRDIINDSWTISGWINRKSTGRALVSKYVTTGDQRAYRIIVETTGSVIVAVSNSGTSDAGNLTEITSAAGALSNDTWHNLVATYNGTTIMVYVDTVGIANGTHSGGVFNSSSELYIGKDSAQYMNGSSDEVRFYNRSLTTAEIALLYAQGRYQNISSAGAGTEADQIVYFPMNEQTGTSIYNLGTLSSTFPSAAIVGPAWANDGISKNLTLGSDYNYYPISALFEPLNSNLRYNRVTYSYSDSWGEPYGFHVTIMELLVGMISLAVLTFMVLFIRKLWGEFYS